MSDRASQSKLCHTTGSKGVDNIQKQLFFFKFLKRFFNVELLMDVALVVEESLVLSLDNIQIMLVALADRENALENLEEVGVVLGGPTTAGGAKTSGT
jgi:hypothetical protein